MAENRAAFSLRRRRSLGFSKCRWLRTSFSVPSRSIFFFNRRNARSTDSPFFSLISVNSTHILSGTGRLNRQLLPKGLAVRGGTLGRGKQSVNGQILLKTTHREAKKDRHKRRNPGTSIRPEGDQSRPHPLVAGDDVFEEFSTLGIVVILRAGVHIPAQSLHQRFVLRNQSA